MRHASSACRLLRRCQHQLTDSQKIRLSHIAVAAEVTGNASFAAAAVSAKDGLLARNSRATMLDGRAVAAAWEKELLGDVQHLTELLGRPPGLGVVLVGNRPDSMLYVTKKQEACHKAGMQAFVHHLPESVSQSQLEAAVSLACADCRVDGVLIQLPLPRHLSEEAVMEVLDPRKDVDGFHPLNMGRMLMRGRGVRLVPATPLGCIELLRRSGVEVQGKTCVVLGDSNIVGTPLAAMLRDKGAAAVTICHRRSYREWFEDQEQVQRTRAAAAVCLPPLPGPTRPPPNLLPPTLTQQQQTPTVDLGVVTVLDGAAAGGGGGLQGGNGGSGGGGGCYGASVYESSFQSYQLPYLTRSADILVVAVGHPELVRGDWVRPGAVVIDVGINVVNTLPRGRSSSTGAATTAAAREDAAVATAVATNSAQAYGSVHCSLGSGGTRATAADAGYEAGMYGGGGLEQRLVGNSSNSCSSSNGGENAGSCRSIIGSSGSSSWTLSGCSLHGSRNVAFHVVGDVAFEEVAQVAGAITPVPGGVGPMTIAAVLHNTLKAAKYRVGLEPW